MSKIPPGRVKQFPSRYRFATNERMQEILYNIDGSEIKFGSFGDAVYFVDDNVVHRSYVEVVTGIPQPPDYHAQEQEATTSAGESSRANQVQEAQPEISEAEFPVLTRAGRRQTRREIRGEFFRP